MFTACYIEVLVPITVYGINLQASNWDSAKIVGISPDVPYPDPGQQIKSKIDNFQNANFLFLNQTL